ncbi:MAG TPA: cytochrome c peroxidase [Flavisolibacter sp.]|jgi:cytochrome c peroxidase|nr:cytochrome c peroxidase [Flavisolibacter sp.]
MKRMVMWKISKKTKLMAVMCIITAACCFLTAGKPKADVVNAVASTYQAQLEALEQSVLHFEIQTETATAEELKTLFVNARIAYKQMEWLVEYHFPSTALAINGPALPEAEPSEPGNVLHPSGFQVLEEKIYNKEATSLRNEIRFELSTIINRVRRLRSLKKDMELSKSNILDALRLQLYRIITKGITGFDSPIANNSIAEVVPSLKSMKTVLSFFDGTATILKRIDYALAFVKQNGDFNKVNRAVFISDYLNPISRAVTTYQTMHEIPFPTEERAIRPQAKTLFDADAWQPLYYAPSGTKKATPKQIALGKILFADPVLSSNGKRSCASCHNPKKAFTDGLALAATLSNSATLLRNTPTLLNAALQPVQFYDSRIAFLEDQVHDVISNQQEMGGVFETIVTALQKNKSYRQDFAFAFSDKQITADNIRAALAAYVRSLTALNSQFDRYMRGAKSAMTSEQIAGFNLFAGKAKCATCHFLPLFNGTVPPLFDKMESEVLGVPANTDTLNAKIDADSGKYHLYKIAHHLFSFKTPSLRNVALTTPYMHNGIYRTLDEVIGFYDRGGGAGLGFELPNQTLPADKLNLTVNEKKQVIAFLYALNDAPD